MDSSTVVNIGVQRFDRLIEEGKFYIDKTGFIREWWENSWRGKAGCEEMVRRFYFWHMYGYL